MCYSGLCPFENYMGDCCDWERNNRIGCPRCHYCDFHANGICTNKKSRYLNLKVEKEFCCSAYVEWADYEFFKDIEEDHYGTNR